MEKLTQIINGTLLRLKKIIIRSFLKKFKKAPCFYSNTEWKNYQSRIYDFSDSKSFHLGDGLNLALLLSNDTSFKLNTYFELEQLLSGVVTKSIPTNEKTKNDALLVKSIGQIKDLKYFIFCKPILLIDLMDLKAPRKLPEYLSESIINKNSLNNNFKVINFERYSNKDKLMIGKYLVVNTELASGSFRINKKDIEKILNEAILFSQKYKTKIVIVGIKTNKLFTNNINYENIIDLRGKLTLLELIKIIGSKQCNAIFSFDNLIMHIGNIFDKKCFIKFRGKSNIEEEKFHFKIVNKSYRKKNNIKYI